MVTRYVLDRVVDPLMKDTTPDRSSHQSREPHEKTLISRDQA
jgi:hypothetical protein